MVPGQLPALDEGDEVGARLLADGHGRVGLADRGQVRARRHRAGGGHHPDLALRVAAAAATAPVARRRGRDGNVLAHLRQRLGGGRVAGQDEHLRVLREQPVDALQREPADLVGGRGPYGVRALSPR